MKLVRVTEAEGWCYDERGKKKDKTQATRAQWQEVLDTWRKIRS